MSTYPGPGVAVHDISALTHVDCQAHIDGKRDGRRHEFLHVDAEFDHAIQEIASDCQQELCPGIYENLETVFNSLDIWNVSNGNLSNLLQIVGRYITQKLQTPLTVFTGHTPHKAVMGLLEPAFGHFFHRQRSCVLIHRGSSLCATHALTRNASYIEIV